LLCPGARLFGLFQPGIHSVSGARIKFCKRNIAEDHGQQVVEVMGKSSGKDADGFELLGTQEVLLHFFAFRNVIRQDEVRPLSVDHDGMGNDLHLDERPVLQAVFPDA
jgi:hypothetical protein